MKTNWRTVILLISSLLISPAFAYISGKPLVNENRIYCPSEITCTEAGKRESCNFVTDKPELWTIYGPPSSNAVIKGKYSLSNSISNMVSSPFHYSGIIDVPGNGKEKEKRVVCTYSNPTLGDKQDFIFLLRSKFEANLEAFIDKTTAWYGVVDKDLMTYCPSNGNPQLCPLKEASAVLINNQNIHVGIFASVNGIKISEILMQNKYLLLSYDDVLAGCGSSKNCKIDLNSSKGAIYGSVTVDMDNKMKILRIDPVRSSAVAINGISPFNAIRIQYPNLKK